jgi:hypothetical protein
MATEERKKRAYTRWTPQEEQIFLEVRNKHPSDYSAFYADIAGLVQKTDKQIYDKYRTFKPSSQPPTPTSEAANAQRQQQKRRKKGEEENEGTPGHSSKLHSLVFGQGYGNTPSQAISSAETRLYSPDVLASNAQYPQPQFNTIPFDQAALPASIAGAQSAARKSLRFEEKARSWHEQGNEAKAQKNREKSLRYKSVTVRKVLQLPAPPADADVIKQDKATKAARCDAKVYSYMQKGNTAKAYKNKEKAARIRSKYGVEAAAPTGQQQ